MPLEKEERMYKLEYEFRGYCGNENCRKNGEEVKFFIPPDKVEVFRNEPPSCTGCSHFLQGDIYEVGTVIEEVSYRKI